jgi:hypothetical protein
MVFTIAIDTDQLTLIRDALAAPAPAGGDARLEDRQELLAMVDATLLAADGEVLYSFVA